MEPRRRRTNASNSSSGVSVVAGSVWESRMKSDQVKGGVKVFNDYELDNNNNNSTTSKMLVLKKPQSNLLNAKRKTWNSDTHHQLNVSVDGVKKSPIHTKKGRSSVDGVSNKTTRKTTRPIEESSLSSCKEIVVADHDKNSIHLRKVKSESEGVIDNVKNLVQLRKVKSEMDKSDKIEMSESESVEQMQCKEFGVCEEKVISTQNDDDVDDFEDEELEDEYEYEYEEEIHDDDDEIEKSSCEVKEINLPEEEAKVKKFDCEVKKVNNNNSNNIKVEVEVEVKKFNEFNDRSAPITSSNAAANQYQRFPQTQNSKLQNLVDLVMWRDISRSAFIFGIGTFTIISSSYTQDLNISFISVISYLGLVYLATRFLYRSIICRGNIDMENDDDDDRNYVLGEGEAIWLLKLVLPYLNEALLKLKALFSGDPATTMKLAVLLFVLARCGNSITIWKVIKLGFFGVFTLPKVCSSYSVQLTAYGTFWIRRFKDAWDSCAHKKAVAIAAFTLMWNLSSVVARIWALFMLFVAFRYYQSTVQDDWEDEGVEIDDDQQQQQQQSRETLQKPSNKVAGRGPTIILAANKIKKGF
ncbi:hypothetical protein ACFE04_002847 [Oxalis oulophora]